jgi:hypothetical protein
LHPGPRGGGVGAEGVSGRRRVERDAGERDSLHACGRRDGASNGRGRRADGETLVKGEAKAAQVSALPAHRVPFQPGVDGPPKAHKGHNAARDERHMRQDEIESLLALIGLQHLEVVGAILRGQPRLGAVALASCTLSCAPRA